MTTSAINEVVGFLDGLRKQKKNGFEYTIDKGNNSFIFKIRVPLSTGFNFHEKTGIVPAQDIDKFEKAVREMFLFN